MSPTLKPLKNSGDIVQSFPFPFKYMKGFTNFKHLRSICKVLFCIYITSIVKKSIIYGLNLPYSTINFASKWVINLPGCYLPKKWNHPWCSFGIPLRNRQPSPMQQVVRPHPATLEAPSARRCVGGWLPSGKLTYCWWTKSCTTWDG